MLYIPVVAGRGKSTWGAFVREDPEFKDGGLIKLSDALITTESTAGLSVTISRSNKLVGEKTAG